MVDTSAAPIPGDLAEVYRSQIEGRPVLLYDGVCVVCNRTVQFLFRHDRNAVLRFAPIESSLGQDLLARYHAARASGPSLEGVVLITHALTPSACVVRRTDAFATILGFLPAPWPAVGTFLRFIPRLIREFGYTLFARYRYRLFGRHTTCPIPTPEQRARILGVPS